MRKILKAIWIIAGVFHVCHAEKLWCLPPQSPYCLDSVESLKPWNSRKCQKDIDLYQKNLQAYLECVTASILSDKEQAECKFKCKLEGQEYCLC